MSLEVGWSGLGRGSCFLHLFLLVVWVDSCLPHFDLDITWRRGAVKKLLAIQATYMGIVLGIVFPLKVKWPLRVITHGFQTLEASAHGRHQNIGNGLGIVLGIVLQSR